MSMQKFAARERFDFSNSAVLTQDICNFQPGMTVTGVEGSIGLETSGWL